VLARSLAKAPEDRYASCRDFADALCAALGLPLSNSKPAISLQADQQQAGTTWPSIADAHEAEIVSAVAAAATLAQDRWASQAGGDIGGGKGTSSGPAVRSHKARHARARPPHHNRRRFRLSVVPAVMLATVLGALALNRPAVPAKFMPTAPLILPSSRVAYLGVYVPGQPAYRPVADFAAAAGKQPNLAGYVTGWDKPFPASWARTLYKNGAAPLIQIDPAGISLAATAAGDDDNYLRAYASSVRRFRHQVVIGFGQDMNAPGHSWGYGNVPAGTFVAAWWHVVTLFRDQGADNVAWLWTISADRPGIGPAAWWWPGAAYVSWIGIDGHYSRPGDTFASVFGRAIAQVRQFTAKPIIVSVTSAGPAAGQYNRVMGIFDGLFRSGAAGLMWPGQAQDPRRVGIDGSAAATAAFRLSAFRLTLYPG
jgi:hypothetical protein